MSSQTVVATDIHCAYCFDILNAKLTQTKSDINWEIPFGEMQLYVFMFFDGKSHTIIITVLINKYIVLLLDPYLLHGTNIIRSEIVGNYVDVLELSLKIFQLFKDLENMLLLRQFCLLYLSTILILLYDYMVLFFNSAMKDSRFLPIEINELPSLRCSISLLHSFTPADSWDDWTVGSYTN